MAVQFSDIPQTTDSAEKHINHFFDHLIACLNQRRLSLLEIARDARIEMAGRPVASAREEEELIGLRAETESRLQINPLRETQLEILDKLDEKLADIRRPYPNTRLLFRGETGELEQMIRDVGEVAEVEEPAVPRYREMRPTMAVARRGRAPGELWHPHGVAVDSRTNQIYVAEGWSSWEHQDDISRVSIFSETGEFLNTFSHEDMRNPWGIAVHNDNVYVTDTLKDFVFHFKVESDIYLVAGLGGLGSGLGQFDKSRQLAVSTNGDVFVTDYNNNRIQILNSDLYYLRHISHLSMLRPRDIKLTPVEVFVLCQSSPCVSVFSYSGDLLRSLITRGIGMQVRDPLFFSLDSDCNLLLSDTSSSQIEIFSKEATLLHTLGRQGHEVGMLHYPHGVALTNKQTLVVVSRNKDYGLQIYSRD